MKSQNFGGSLNYNKFFNMGRYEEENLNVFIRNKNKNCGKYSHTSLDLVPSALYIICNLLCLLIIYASRYILKT